MLYEEILEKAGFSKEQALIYSFLLKNGPSPAKKLLKNLPIKRGLLYKVLDQLKNKGFVEREDKDESVSLFKPKHPRDILEDLENQKKTIQIAAESVRATLGQMTSDFNLISGRPNIQFFEGKEGIKSVLEDSLYAKEEIYSYADIESIEKNIKEVNAWYVKEREKFNIKKRGLVLDTPFNKKFLEDYYTNITDTRLLKIESAPFATIMQMYDDKISYITFGEQMIGVIITNPHICEMHRKLFELNWSNSTPLTQP